MAILARSRFSLALAFCTAGALTSGACGNPDQKESKILANKAVEAANNKRWAKAEQLLEKATATYRDNDSAWFNLGFVREQQKDFEGAAEAYSEAARVKDGDATYHYKLGKAYWNNDNMSQAQSALERAVELNSKLYEAQYQLGKVYEKVGKPKKAAVAWTASANLAPTFGMPFIELGNLYIKWSYLDQAVSVLDQGRMNVRDGDELTNIYYNLGRAYGNQAHWEKAIGAYSKSIDTRKTNLDALRQRGFAYAKINENDKAKIDLNSFVEQGGGGKNADVASARQLLNRLSSAN